MRGGQACLCALCAFVPLTNLDRLYAVLHGSHADAIQLEPFETMLKRAAAKLLRKRPELNRNGREARERRKRLIDGEGRLILPPGGLQNMADYHFVLVRGGAWKAGDALW